ncbi:uncharacterized protein LJ206_020398 [Theristicus caerulescens]
MAAAPPDASSLSFPPQVGSAERRRGDRHSGRGGGGWGCRGKAAARRPWPGLPRRYRESGAGPLPRAEPAGTGPGRPHGGDVEPDLGTAPRALPRRPSEPRPRFVPGPGGSPPAGGGRAEAGAIEGPCYRRDGGGGGRAPFYSRAAANFPLRKRGPGAQPRREGPAAAPAASPPRPRRVQPQLCRGGVGSATALPERGYPRGTAASPTGRAGCRGRLGPGGARGEQTDRPPGTAAAVANGAAPPGGVTPAPAPRPGCPSPAARALSPPAAPSLLPPSPALQPASAAGSASTLEAGPGGGGERERDPHRHRHRAGASSLPPGPSTLLAPPARQGCGDPEPTATAGSTGPSGASREEIPTLL